MLTEKIPGYAGYADRERRRDADKQVRSFVADALDHAKGDLDTVKLLLTDQAKLDQVGVIERLSQRVESSADRIRTATYGFAGLFDAQKVGDGELARLYEFDGSLADNAQAIRSQCGAVLAAAQGNGDFAAACGQVDAALRSLDGRFNDRARALTG